MSSFRTTLKRYTPRPVWEVGSNTYWWWRNRGRHELARRTSPVWKESLARLETFHNLHRGKRCFLIGNGPSLRNTDLSRLKDEYTIGLNRIYLLFPELGFNTNYLVSVNELVLEQCAEEMKSLQLPKFITWRARNWFVQENRLPENTIFLDTDFTGDENFSEEVVGRIFEGFTVTYVGLQLAYYMGFEEVFLIGVDHNFTTQGTPNQEVTSDGDDPNHFAPNYFGKGFRWQLPDLQGSERAYRMARKAFADRGRAVIDATVGGKLTVFPKIEYDSLFADAPDSDE